MKIISANKQGTWLVIIKHYDKLRVPYDEERKEFKTDESFFRYLRIMQYTDIRATKYDKD